MQAAYYRPLGIFHNLSLGGVYCKHAPRGLIIAMTLEI